MFRSYYRAIVVGLEQCNAALVGDSMQSYQPRASVLFVDYGNVWKSGRSYSIDLLKKMVCQYCCGRVNERSHLQLYRIPKSSPYATYPFCAVRARLHGIRSRESIEEPYKWHYLHIPGVSFDR